MRHIVTEARVRFKLTRDGGYERTALTWEQLTRNVQVEEFHLQI